MIKDIRVCALQISWCINMRAWEVLLWEAFYLLLIIGIIFGSLGAICAYLITYKEWQHHYPSPEIPRKMALETAIFTFIFFLMLMIVAGLVVK